MAAYATADEAQEYFDERLHTDPWDVASDSDKDKALAMATKIIDRLNFSGAKTLAAQENQFPRDGDTTVPVDILYATCEVSLALLDGIDPEIEYENLYMVSQGYGTVRSNYDRSSGAPNTVSGLPSAAAWRFLRPYLRDPNSLTLDRLS